MSKRILQAIADPATSNWVRKALNNAVGRDPVDAANDAELVAELLKEEADAVFAAGVGRVAYQEPVLPADPPLLRAAAIARNAYRVMTGPRRYPEN